ncbi:hypothetical protein WKW79_25590 [Variovorax robiniae]|uniref:Uncharacterized protein n=1 Tax=Variovorax robiniae TaxID=1836199 RepID=A0ABU8XDU9_9BURK
MALKGKGFMAVWHDIKTEGEAEYSLWHTREHMPERVSTPGFLRGRRFVDWSLDKHRWYTLYEGAETETFSSDVYRAKLNSPTPWTTRMQPNFLNFVRSACETIATNGVGTGGAMATVRVHYKDGGADAFRAAAKALADNLLQLDGVTGVHIGWANPTVTRVKTKETELRADTGEDIFDAVVHVEGVGRPEVTAVMKEVERQIAATGVVRLQEAAVYDLAYLLESEEL